VAAIARFATWVCLFELLWAVFSGTTQSTELIAGLIASALAALLVEALRAQGVLRFTPSLRGLGRVWKLPGEVVFDFVLVLGILVRALARGRRVRGEWVEIPYRTRGPGARFQRAIAGMLGNESANAIVVELDGDRAVLHSLEPRAPTGRSVL
jgi:hypothetical protein